jgi:hypothetical protein
MRFHAEVPLVALLGLVHLWISLALLILGRARGCDDRRIHHRTFSESQPLNGQMFVDGRKDAFGQLVLLQQAAKLEQGGGIGDAFTREVDADKSPDGLTVVKGVLSPFVGETEALLGNLHSQHAFQPHRRTASAFAFGVKRFNLGHQRRPRRDAVYLAEEAITPRDLLLGGVLQIRKTRLHRQNSAYYQYRHSFTS